MFERFTERARQVVVLAQEEARTLGHAHIGTEHILLGLLREEEGIAARVLESLGITADGVRTQVVRIIPPVGDESLAEVRRAKDEALENQQYEKAAELRQKEQRLTTTQILFTPRGKRVLEVSLREALGLGQNYIGTEHILLALVRENDGVAARILLDCLATPEKIHDEVIRMLSGPGVRRANPPRETLTGIEWEMGYAYVLVHARKIRVCLKRGDYGAALDEARNVTSMLERLV